MLISNPFVSPYFRPLLAVLVALLGGALLLLLLLARLRPRQGEPGVLFRRWRVWAVIAPIYTLAVLGGELTTLALLTVLIWQGLREYAVLVGLPARDATALRAAGLLAAPVALLSLNAFYVLAPLLLIAATLQPLLLRRPAGGVRHLA